MKISKRALQKIIQEELASVLDEKNLTKEHRGEPCEKLQGKPRRDCEERAAQAKEDSQKKTQKRRQYSANHEELQALQRAKVYEMNPPLRTRADQIKPMDAINPDIGKELTQEKKSKNKKICSSRKDKRGHNIYHDKDGRLTTKDKAVTKSVRAPQNEPCKYAGQSKHNPHKWTKITCGRKDRLNPNVKAQYRCYDGKEVSERLVRDGLIDADIQVYDAGDWFIIRKDTYEDIIQTHMLDLLDEFREEFVSGVYPLEEQANQQLIQRCQQAGLRTFEQFLNSFNSLMLSSKGELNKPQK